MGLKEDFDDGYLFDVFGKITGTATATALPDIPASLARFKVAGASLYIGSNPNNCVFLMEDTFDTGWIPTHNLNKYFIQGVTGTSPYLYYWAKL